MGGGPGRVAAVLTAAGSGTRLGHSLPKALVPLCGEPLVAHAARRLLEARTAAGERVTVLVVTAPGGAVDQVRALLEPVADGVVLRVVPGGPTRQASVAAGLDALAGLAGMGGHGAADGHGAPGGRGGLAVPEVVLVHDAARPLAPAELVARVVEAVRAGHGAVVPGLAVADTIKRVGPARPGTGPVVQPVEETVPRTDLRAVQTPQGFGWELLRRAHREGAHAAHDETVAASDDAGLVERLGEPVWVVAGDERAEKITTARDLVLAEVLAGAPSGDPLRAEGVAR